MAASVLKNLASKGDPRGEFNSQGAIRPLVNLLRVSQENNDLENTRNIVTCMEHISESPDNGRALRCDTPLFACQPLGRHTKLQCVDFFQSPLVVYLARVVNELRGFKYKGKPRKMANCVFQVTHLFCAVSSFPPSNLTDVCQCCLCRQSGAIPLLVYLLGNQVRAQRWHVCTCTPQLLGSAE
jgi:hypothetical protein